LAGESSADDINGNSICLKAIGRELSNVGITWDVRPVPGEYGSAEWLPFAKGDGAEAGSLKAEAKPANTRE
jgi:hypothetical protein